MTTASTRTATYARFSILKFQVAAIIDRVGGLRPATIERVMQGISSPHYIKTLVAAGAFPDDTLGAELRFTIDWRQHALELKTRGSDITVPNHWKDGVSTTVSQAAQIFKEACEEADLEIDWGFVYDDSFDRHEVNQILGFSPAESRKWRREPDVDESVIDAIPEATVTLKFGF